ncbi:SubName: Full=Uncharacterized protein {ECO:0000313/EMBL:CCA67091.1} [Serendipita indica DSM 11827]|nr:SubName: Full=Uncharacterized protein {ECO:0000313/EMBL:CCA67091.1} [Serendipita indica DSM 11827]
MDRPPYSGARLQGSRTSDGRFGASREGGRETKYSIFDDLLGQDHQRAKEQGGLFPLLRCLLEVTTHTALGAHVNILTTLAFVRAARQECARLENSMNGPQQDTLGASLALFRDNIECIKRLENILLEDWDHTNDSSIFDSKSVLECRTSIDLWEQNRTQVVNKLLRVSELSGESRPDPDNLWEARRDDALILRTMVEHIPTDSGVTDDNFKQSHNALQNLMALAESEKQGAGGVQYSLERKARVRTAYAIKAAWLIRVTVEESKNKSFTKPLRRRYLRRTDVWATAYDFVSSIANGNVAPTEVEQKYQTFVYKLLSAFVLNTDSTLSPQALLDLFAAGAHVSRPFMSQNHALVELCYELGQQYSSTGVGDLDKLEAVQDAISRCLDAANAARREQVNLATMQQPNKGAIEQAYRIAYESVKAALRSLSSPEINTIDATMTQARAEDEERMRAYQERFAKAQLTQPSTRMVRVRMGNRDIIVPDDTRIAALIWSEQQNTRQRIIGIRRGGVLVEPHRTIGEIAGGAGALQLDMQFATS